MVREGDGIGTGRGRPLDILDRQQALDDEPARPAIANVRTVAAANAIAASPPMPYAGGSGRDLRGGDPAFLANSI